MVVTTTTVATLGSGAVLGGAALILLIVALITKEISAHSGNERLLPLQRALNVALAPLAIVVAVVLAQHVSSLM